MNIPPEYLQIAVVGVVSFVFKVTFGLINKNEQKSDKEDEKLEKKIDQAIENMAKIQITMRDTDRHIYGEQLKLAIDNAYMKGFKDGRND